MNLPSINNGCSYWKEDHSLKASISYAV